MPPASPSPSPSTSTSASASALHAIAVFIYTCAFNANLLWMQTKYSCCWSRFCWRRLFCLINENFYFQTTVAQRRLRKLFKNMLALIRWQKRKRGSQRAISKLRNMLNAAHHQLGRVSCLHSAAVTAPESISKMQIQVSDTDKRQKRRQKKKHFVTRQQHT